MKKLIIVLSCFLVLFLFFAGCKTLEDAIQDTVDQKVAEKVESTEDSAKEEIGESIFGNYKTGSIPFISPNQGKPQFNKSTGPAYFIWRDNNGWHLRMKSNNKNHIFAGKIITDAKISSFESIGGIKSKVSVKDKRQITWTVPHSKGTLVGFDFKCGMEAVKFKVLTINGNPVVMKKVVISRAMWNPIKIPFTLKPNAAPQF